jgi:monoamine oxidase
MYEKQSDEPNTKIPNTNTPNTTQIDEHRRNEICTADVVVIGAGIAGVEVARQMIKAGKSVLLLEADTRVGGRLRTHRLPDGTCFDLGGQWIGPPDQMPRINALIAEFGLTIFNQMDSGRMDMTAHRLESMDRLTRTEWEWFQAKLGVLADQVNELNPSLTPGASKLDSISVEEWKRRNLSSEYLQHVFDQIVRTEYTIEPKDVSMLHFLHGLKTCGGLEAMFSSEGGSHTHRVVEGFQTLVERMVLELGDSIRLGCQVYDIFHSATGIKVVAEGMVVTAQRVVVAVPPNQAQRIDFSPVLPRRRMWLMQRLEMGSVIKCFAIYDQPFWRGRPVEPVDPDDLIFDHTLDSSSHDEKHPALVAFIGGSDAVYWSDQTFEARKKAVLEGLSRVFGREALYPRRYFDHDWLTEPYIGGGYNCYAPPGVMTAGYEEIDEPIGRIHFAGTETAQYYEGYIEGALESADRAAREVIAALEQDTEQNQS